MKAPTVSVIIPTYNRARFLNEAIDSALNQIMPALEVIVVDDGSVDSTPQILDKYGTRIQVIAQKNSGVAAARNAGIFAAKGEYVALLDSDDSWLPDKLIDQMNLALKYPEAILIHTLCRTINEKSELIPSSVAEYPEQLEEDALERLMGHCYPTTSSYVIPTPILREIGGFDVKFEQGGGFAAEDWHLCLRLAERGPFAGVGKLLTNYRVHNDSKTLSDRLPHTLGLIKLRGYIELHKDRWLENNNSLSFRHALQTHKSAFAHVYSRLGLIYQERGEYNLARDAFKNALQLEPLRLKHRLRYIRMYLSSKNMTLNLLI